VPLLDLLREEHIRRLSLILQRHGLNLLLSHQLRPGPVTADIANSTPRCGGKSTPSTDLAGILAKRGARVCKVGQAALWSGHETATAADRGGAR
jgi:hypothetical protein